MHITGREAARWLSECHLLSRPESQRVISGGLAGPPRRMGAGLLYDADAVYSLLERPMCPTDVLDRWRPFIGRLARWRGFDLAQPWEEQAQRARRGWCLRVFSWLQAHHGYAPGRCAFVGTVGGFAAFGADIVGVRGDVGPDLESPEPVVPRRGRQRATYAFDLVPPGSWWEEVKDTWLPLKNGAASRMWGQRPTGPLTIDGKPIDYLRADTPDQIRRAREAELTSSTWALRDAASRAARPPDRR